MFCKNCGQQVADNASFCPNCGQSVNAQTNNAQQASAQGNVPPQGNNVPPYSNANAQQAKGAVNQILDTPDHTAEYTQQEINDGKVMNILCYIGILVLIPLFAEKNNRCVRFHVNQGLVLFIFEIIANIVMTIFSFVPVLGVIVSTLIGLAELAMMIFGIVYVAQNKVKELPLIGHFKWIN